MKRDEKISPEKKLSFELIFINLTSGESNFLRHFEKDILSDTF